jgi:hypothetical protein
VETATNIGLPALHRYPDHSRRSGVVAYAVRGDGIAVEFVDGRIYLYNYEVPGRRHVERMKTLAAEGSGLSSYISRHVGKRFAARLR